jgi:diguanylate cyclase (GGDEF)-like protein
MRSGAGDGTGFTACPACGGSGYIVDPASRLDEGALRDHDQTASDQDQTWSDHDQTTSDRDQRSADEDQEASDDDFAAGGDPITHRRTSLARERATRDRAAVSELRDETATERFRTAAERDQAAELRDRGGEARDRVARELDLRYDVEASREEVLLRAERDRARAAADRAKAADDRVRAAADRRAAAREREEAARVQADARRQLRLAATDELTTAWSRQFGLAEVIREVERARRTGSTLMLAFIDVDRLKTVNDTHGHAAGDRLLHLVVTTTRTHVRPYDLIVRYGGDEFLCLMPNIARAAARERMQTIAAQLTRANDGHSITFGLAEYQPDDSIEELVSRADTDLLDNRRRRDNN